MLWIKDVMMMESCYTQVFMMRIFVMCLENHLDKHNKLKINKVNKNKQNKQSKQAKNYVRTAPSLRCEAKV